MAGTRMKKMASGLNARQKKAVTAIAKKTTLKIAETKSAVSVYQTDLFNDLVYALNLNYFLAQGSTSETIVGEKFFLKNIYLKGRFYSYNTASPGNSPLHCRLMVIRTKKALTNTFASQTISDIFRGSAVEVATTGFPDLHKIDVIKDVHFRVPQATIGTSGTSTSFTHNLKINKTLFTDTDNSGYLKDKNYYIIATCYKADNPAVNVGALRVQWALNFKDV